MRLIAYRILRETRAGWDVDRLLAAMPRDKLIEWAAVFWLEWQETERSKLKAEVAAAVRT